MAGHMGIRKTEERIRAHFYWPKMHRDIVMFCSSCHSCQVSGKPQHNPKPAPLQPIPAFGEPFSRVIIDCVGPLPKTKSGNSYLLTIMCAATRKKKKIKYFDLAKGYWHVPLTGRVSEIAAFTQDGLFQCKVMPFGMKNAPATFQRLMNSVIEGVPGCVVYLDDVVLYGDDWQCHVGQMRSLFRALADIAKRFG